MWVWWHCWNGAKSQHSRRRRRSDAGWPWRQGPKLFCRPKATYTGKWIYTECTVICCSHRQQSVTNWSLTNTGTGRNVVERNVTTGWLAVFSLTCSPSIDDHRLLGLVDWLDSGSSIKHFTLSLSVHVSLSILPTLPFVSLALLIYLCLCLFIFSPTPSVTYSVISAWGAAHATNMNSNALRVSEPVNVCVCLCACVHY